MTKARDLANIISGGFTADDIPSLDTAKITTGTFADARIPSLDASKIATGTIDDARISSTIANQKSDPYRNIIINGDMSIAQRGTSTASITSEGYYTVDRFAFYPNSLGTFTMSQNTDVPTGQGFSKSIKLDCTTANASPSASNFIHIQHRIEGQMLQYLKKGTSSAESLTLSFWVKSTKTGTVTVEFFDIDNSRSNSQTFTINSASTWEKKTITIDGDTTGAFTNDNGASLYLIWWLGTGSTYNSGTLNTSWNSRVNANIASSSNINLADSTSNDFWITGVQLEAGTTASDFEFLPYDVNLQRCQRYFQKSGTFMGVATNTTTMHTNIYFPVPMRVEPSLTTSGTILISEALANYDSTSNPVDVFGNSDGIGVTQAGYSGLTQFRAYIQNVSSGTFKMDSEL